MATTEELLALANEEESEIEYLTVDNDLRTIDIPEDIALLGVESDEKVRRLYFKMPATYGEFDLSTFQVRVNYMNAGGNIDIYLVEDAESDGETITFSWLVGRNACMYKGTVNFIVCLILADSNGTVQQEFNTTLAHLAVLEGLEVDQEEIYEQVKDIISQLLGVEASAEETIKELESAAALDAENAASSAESASNSASSASESATNAAASAESASNSAESASESAINAATSESNAASSAESASESAAKVETIVADAQDTINQLESLTETANEALGNLTEAIEESKEFSSKVDEVEEKIDNLSIPAGYHKYDSETKTMHISDGTVTLDDYTVPIASTEKLGYVQVGNLLTVTDEGLLAVDVDALTSNAEIASKIVDAGTENLTDEEVNEVMNTVTSNS